LTQQQNVKLVSGGFTVRMTDQCW